MPSLKSIVGLALLGLLLVETGHAQESEDCPYPKGREIQGLAAALAAHEEWVEKRGWENPDVPGRANFCNADLSKANLVGADLSKANLEGADLFEANLEGADLTGANLEGAFLGGVKLQGAYVGGAKLQGATLVEANLQGATLVRAKLQWASMWAANLQGADLFEANLQGADLTGANLEGADLTGANLEGATLGQTVLADARLSGADLSGALYQPVTAPAQGYLSGLRGLRSVRFCPGEGSGLVQLRTALKAAGLRDLEREATYVLERGRTRHALERWNPAVDETSPCDLPERDPMAAIEGALRLVFFEWTTGYGLYPGRAIRFLLVLIGLGALIYVVPILQIPPAGDERLSGIYKVWSKERVAKVGRDEPERVHATRFAAFLYALYFSLLTAFHFGWRDLNVGNWIARMQRREYALRATGWVRVISGVQSLISVYLIAMWVLTYFGRPFE